MPPSNQTESTGARQLDNSLAYERLASPFLHQRFWIPETSSHPKLRVTFSTTSNWEHENLPVILFFAPMFGNRWHMLAFDKLAQDEGMRVIFTDRPGMCGSTPVPLEQRMQIWLETVPLLLQKLNIQHVSFVSHSAGTIYLFNSLYHHREFLEPKAPYAALVAPWVHCEHSDAFLMNMASIVPAGVITGAWSRIIGFVTGTIQPAISFSGDIASLFMQQFKNASSEDVDSGEILERYGVDERTWKEMWKLTMKYIQLEGLRAGGDEALMCLKKGAGDSWGICDNYPGFANSLLRKEKSRVQYQADAARLKLEFYYADSDIMIGQGGRKYMQECWSDTEVAGLIDVSNTVCPKTNHETVLLDVKKGALKLVFAKIKSLHSDT